MNNPDPTGNFGGFLHKITKDLDNVTTQSADLPPKSDLSFHRTLDKELSKKLDEASSRVLDMAQELLKLVDPHFTSKQKGFADPAEDLTDRYRKNVVPSVDGLLEQTDTMLDELQGNKKKAAIQIKPALEALAKQKLPGPFAAQNDMPTRTTSEKMRKPQLDFLDPVNNSNDRPAFTPTLPVKHHAMVPLDFVPPNDYILPADTAEAKIRLRHELEWRRHPYFYETRHLPYPTSMFTAGPVIKPAPIESTEPIWVDKPDQLAEMVEQLKQAKEIGVDLEHHNTHSFHGFTCLMQISTRERDWLIDTLALRGVLREDKLGGVMADPSIVKKDFDIYVVNLFDTYHATKVLDIRPHSLANLLALFCGYHADKKYQTADWRLRPLTKEMKLYAQADTHFILSIYDNLRNALLEKSRAPSPDPEHAGSPAPSAATNPQRAMREVLTLSGETAMRLWSPEAYMEDGTGNSGWKTGIAKSFQGKVEFESEVGIMYKRIHMWRDRVAREEDESVVNVFYRSLLESLSQYPPQTLAALRQRLGQRFVTAARRSEELWKVMTDAQAEWRELEAAKEVRSRSQGSASPKPSPKSAPKSKSAPKTSPKTSPQTSPKKLSKAAQQSSADTPAAPTATERVQIPTSILFPQTGPAAAAAPKRTTTSTLFGSAVTAKPKAGLTSALKRKAVSTLFGSSKKAKAAPEPAPRTDSGVGSSSILDDIRRSIAADMAPKAPVAKADVSKAPNSLPEPETVPFVPAAQRSTAGTSELTFGKKQESAKDDVEMSSGSARKDAEDSDKVASAKKGTAVESTSSTKAKTPVATKLDEPEIVTVKKAAKKSKKRTAEEPKVAAAVAEGSGAASETAATVTTKKRKTAAADVPEFDYSSVPNLLDNPKAAMAESNKKGKKNKAGSKKVKKDKPPAISGTTFGKVPQDMSQPKGGNRSKTFK